MYEIKTFIHWTSSSAFLDPIPEWPDSLTTSTNGLIPWARQTVFFYLNITELTIVLFCCLYGDKHQNDFFVCAKQFVGTVHSLLYSWYDIPIPYRTLCIPILASRHRVSICLLRMTSRLAAQCTLGLSNHCAGAWKVVSNSNVDYI